MLGLYLLITLFFVTEYIINTLSTFDETETHLDSVMKSTTQVNNETDLLQTMENHFESEDSFYHLPKQNLIVHKDVFECKVCDLIFVDKTKFGEHLNSNAHLALSEQVQEHSSIKNDLQGKSNIKEDAKRKYHITGNIVNVGIKRRPYRKKNTVKKTTPDLSSKQKNNLNLDVMVVLEKFDVNNMSSKRFFNDTKCLFCDFKANNENELGSHVEENHENKNLKCTLCDYFAMSVTDKEEHDRSYSHKILCS